MIFTLGYRGTDDSEIAVFRDHKAAAYGPTKPSDAPVFGLCKTITPQYSLNKDSLAAIIGSSFLETPLPSTGFFNLNNIPYKDLTSLPKVGLSFARTAVKEEATNTLARYDFSFLSSRNGDIYQGPLKFSRLAKVLEMKPSTTTRCPEGVMNLQGYIAFALANRLAYGYLATNVANHTYSASPEYTNYTFKTATAGKHPKVTSDGAFSKAVYELKNAIPDTGVEYYNPRELRSVKSSIMTSPDKVRGGMGQVFPYFKGMFIYDDTFIFHQISKHFSRCLGDTPDACVATMAAFRQGMRSMSKTDAADQLAHIYMGIDLSITTGSYLALVRNDEKQYLGFTLLYTDKDAVISVGGKAVKALDKKEFEKEARSLDSHADALNKIAAVLAAVPPRDADQEDVSIDKIDTPRKLRLAIRRRNLSQEAARTIRETLNDLHYVQTYWAVTTDNVVEMLKLLSDDREIPLDAPMYIKENVLFSESRESEVLSLFGPTAPSFISKSNAGKRIHIPGPGEEDIHSVRDDKGDRPLEAIPVFVKGFTEALNNLFTTRKEHVMVFKRTVKGMPAGTTYQFTGEARDKVWKVLRKACGPTPAGPAPARKRKAEATLIKEDVDGAAAMLSILGLKPEKKGSKKAKTGDTMDTD